MVSTSRRDTISKRRWLSCRGCKLLTCDSTCRRLAHTLAVQCTQIKSRCPCFDMTAVALVLCRSGTGILQNLFSVTRWKGREVNDLDQVIQHLPSRHAPLRLGFGKTRASDPSPSPSGPQPCMFFLSLSLSYSLAIDVACVDSPPKASSYSFL
jgi:hypothetical protein